MFSIFKKNVYLVDLIGGITDFHNHLLPGIDDGAKTVEESLRLIQEFENIGIHNFVATPHVIGEYYPNTRQTISEAYESLKPNLPGSVKLSYAAEYMMDQHFIDIIENKEVLTLTKNKVLVEMSYFQPPINLNEILFKIITSGHKPILAHPERYAYYHSSNLDKLKDLKDRGCYFQMNILSLTPHYGQKIQKTANQLLEFGMMDFISSDVHRLEHLEKLEKISLNKKQVQLIKPVIERSKALFN